MNDQSYELADIGTRFMALVIDWIILAVIGSIIGAGGGGIAGGSLLSFLIGVGYHWYCLTRNNGQTIGKIVTKIRVIKTDGSKISDSDAILRYVGYYINSVVIMLGWIWAFFDSNNQGWHDKIANTYVIKVE